MQHVYVLTFDTDELSPPERRQLKAWLGSTVRHALDRQVAVAIDQEAGSGARAPEPAG